jgi:adenylate cyclase
MGVTSVLSEEGFHPGYQLGDYTLLERIGHGGQAVVWSGWDNRRQRVVAIKLILAQGSADEVSATLDNFEREVHLVASLEHPNILPLYEFGSASIFHYFVMRYSSMGSLREWLSTGPIPPQETLRLAAQITSALGYLHDHSIVHRDLKPSNILLDSRKRAYLTDFGLARRLSEVTALLHTGRGTRWYASPEQHSGFRAMPESDIYSLGILFYLMLTGKLPWGGTSDLASRQLQGQPAVLPDPRDENPALPAPLAPVLRRMTAADPGERPDSAVEAFDLFTRALLGDTTSERASTFLATLRQPLPTLDDQAVAAQDAQYLAEHTLADWDPGTEEFGLGITHFALIDDIYSRATHYGLSLEDHHYQFMLRGALAHGRSIGHWWRQLAEPTARLRVCEQVIANEDEAVVGRVLAQMLGEPDEALPLEMLSAGTLERLVDLATGAGGAALRRDALRLLERAAGSPKRWQPVSFTEAVDTKLAHLALGDSPQAEQAVQVIGKAHSETAFRALLNERDQVEASRLRDTLREIRAVAGSLPGDTPVSVRLQIATDLARQQLLEDRASLSWSRSLIGLLIGLLTSLMMVFGLFPRLDARMYDVLLELMPYPISGIVTIVEVNDASLERYGRWESWPRTLHAELIDRVSEAGAGAIALDFNFVSETPDDTVLADAMNRAGNVVQPVTGRGNAYRDIPGTYRYLGGIWPQPDLLAASAATGHTNVLHDNDGYVRRMPTIITIEGENQPSLALGALQVYLRGETDTVEGVLPIPTGGLLKMVGREIPVGSQGDMFIHYAGPPAQPDASTFRTVSYHDVLDGKVDAEFFKDKIVLVGITATAEPDRYLTPVSQGYPMYGVEIHANAIETIWSDRFIARPPSWVLVGVLLLLGLLTGLVCTRPWLGLALAFGEAALYFVVAGRLFDRHGTMLGLFYPFLAIALSYVMVTAYRFSVEIRRRQEIMRLFEARVNPQVAQATLSAVQKGEINLGGEVQEVSALSVDMRGHTAYAELYEPEEMMAMVNALLGMVKEVVFDREGTLTYHEGDRATAIFNAPLAQPDHAWRAVQTALMIRERVEAYHESLPSDHPQRLVNFGYGVHTGRALVGHTGSASRHAYTALGDTVDIVSQLTEVAGPGEILIGDATYEKVVDLVEAAPHPPVSVPGRSTSVQAFSVAGPSITRSLP